MVNLFIYLCIYMVGLLNYSLAYAVFFHGRRKKIWIDGIAGAGYFLVLVNSQLEPYEYNLIMYVILLSVLLITIQASFRERLARVLMLFFVIGLFESIVDSMLRKFSLFREGSNLSNKGYLLCSLIILLIFGLAILGKRKKVYLFSKPMKILQQWLPVMLIVMAIFLLLTIAGLKYAAQWVEHPRFTLFVEVVSILGPISVGLLGIFLIYIKNTNERMKELMDIERSWAKLNTHTYELLLEKEEDTRRYRHDENGHLACLLHLLEHQKYDAAKDYVLTMQGQLKNLQKACYQVGNEVFNAILNYYIPMLSSDVEVKVSGYFSKEIAINAMDLCTIFSNLIQNAVEAIECDESEEKYLRIQLNQGSEYIEVTIHNSYIKDETTSKGKLPFSKKEDDRNHGFGLRNVSDALVKYEGNHTMDFEENGVISKVRLRYK